jgi:AAA domain
MNAPVQAVNVELATMIETDTEIPEKLTRERAVSIVQRWVKEDEEVDLPERRTVEEMLAELKEVGDCLGSDVAVAELSQIVTQYAPKAPTVADVAELKQVAAERAPNTNTIVDRYGKEVSYPPELKPLIESGIVTRDKQNTVWLISHCNTCGQFNTKCCGEVGKSLAVRDGGILTKYGRQAVGLDPIKRPSPPMTVERAHQERLQKIDQEEWWSKFRSVGELQGGGVVKMYVENFLPEGVTLICGLPKEGKSWLALSVAKALTSGKPMFGMAKYEVPEPVPVLYLAAESGDGALKLRCEKMGITTDKTLFVARTLGQGVMLGLDDPAIEKLVRLLHPVIVLETLIRFNEGTDEDSSTENRKLAGHLFKMIAWGAKAVIGIHHSRKDLNKAKPTKEAAVRGSGDALAMVDCVWLVMQDDKTFQRGKGPNEVDVVGWGRDFVPLPIRLALTKRAPKGYEGKVFAPGIVSNIDTKGDLAAVAVGSGVVPTVEPVVPIPVAGLPLDQQIEKMVEDNPHITKKTLAKACGVNEWTVRGVLNNLNFTRKTGGKGIKPWLRTVS